MIGEFVTNGLGDTNTVARSHYSSLHVSLVIHATRHGLNHGRGLKDAVNHRDSFRGGWIKKTDLGTSLTDNSRL